MAQKQDLTFSEELNHPSLSERNDDHHAVDQAGRPMDARLHAPLSDFSSNVEKLTAAQSPFEMLRFHTRKHPYAAMLLAGIAGGATYTLVSKATRGEAQKDSAANARAEIGKGFAEVARGLQSLASATSENLSSSAADSAEQYLDAAYRLRENLEVAGSEAQQAVSNAGKSAYQSISNFISEHPQVTSAGVLTALTTLGGVLYQRSNQDWRKRAGSKGGAAPRYEERTREELYQRARELEIDGRSTMSKDELIDALRNHH